MKALVAEGDYLTAATIADTINWRKIKNVTALVRAGEIYEQVGILSNLFYTHVSDGNKIKFDIPYYINKIVFVASGITAAAALVSLLFGIR